MPDARPLFLVQVVCPITKCVRYAVALGDSWTTDPNPLHASIFAWGAARETCRAFGKLWHPRIIARDPSPEPTKKEAVWWPA